MSSAMFAQEKAAPAKPNVMDPSSLKGALAGDVQGEVHHYERRLVIQVTRAWAPNERIASTTLSVRDFSRCGILRVLSGFMAQFGIPADPAVARVWMQANIPDDPVKASNKRGS